MCDIFLQVANLFQLKITSIQLKLCFQVYWAEFQYFVALKCVKYIKYKILFKGT